MEYGVCFTITYTVGNHWHRTMPFKKLVIRGINVHHWVTSSDPKPHSVIAAFLPKHLKAKIEPLPRRLFQPVKMVYIHTTQPV